MPAETSSKSDGFVQPADIADIPATMQPVEVRRFARRGATRWYVAAFILLQGLVLLSMFFVASTEWFLWHDHYPGLRNFGYSQRAGRLGCEVLIYGDSSSLTGMDPAIIQGITGLKTCNVSEGVTEQLVVGSDAPLQAYLRQNPAPRFLIGTWSGTMFRADIAPYSDYQAEGVMYALHFGGRRQLARHMLRHPAWAIKFSIWALQGLVMGAVDELTSGGRRPIDARSQRDARMGQWPYPRPPETRCVRDDLHIEPGMIGSWPESIAAFRRKYSSPVTTVLMDISPAAECDKLYDTYVKRAGGLYDNVYERLPIRDFNEGDVHFSAEGSRHISEEAGRQILERMGRDRAGAVSGR